MLPPDRVGDERARAWLVREARAAAALEHPYIASVYDIGETQDGGAYLVMELVRGQSLRALMQAGALGKDELLAIFGELAQALDDAHAQGVLHRDVNPDNVMVREDGRAALLDFGLARTSAWRSPTPSRPRRRRRMPSRRRKARWSARSRISRPSKPAVATSVRAAISLRSPRAPTKRSWAGCRGTAATRPSCSRRSSSTTRLRPAASTRRSRRRSMRVRPRARPGARGPLRPARGGARSQPATRPAGRGCARPASISALASRSARGASVGRTSA